MAIKEDVDVRTLGRGRPFALECLNPRKTHYNFEEIRSLEDKINSDGRIIVKHLQVVNNDSVMVLKFGEEKKTKTYCVYCIAFGSLTKEKLESLSSMAPIQLIQKTPVRVLHRRPLADRLRIVHAMKAIPHNLSTEPDKPSYFKLYVLTQAGTYIKEFVHGDFGRTIPSLCDLLENPTVDVLALDVQDVNLDWPPPVQYIIEEKNLL